MSVGSTNYPQPVQVNGFTCRNCTDVDYAKKHIDPAHPKSGPYGINAATDPTQKNNPPQKTGAVTFGGSLTGAGASTSGSPAASPTTTAASQPGQSLDIQA